MSNLSEILDELAKVQSDLSKDLFDVKSKYDLRINTLKSKVTLEMSNNIPVPTPVVPASGPVLISQRVVSPGKANPSDGRSRRAATQRQLDYASALARDKFARIDGQISNRLEASQVIGELQKLDDVPGHLRDVTTAITTPEAEPEPQPMKVEDKIDLNVLRLIPDGRYAVNNDADTQTVFLRLATKKKDGSRRVQYKSSDSWITAQVYWPSGQVTGRNEIHGSVIADLLTQIMMDKGGCADRYGARFSECVNCGRELTDDRSRYYRLGSECIQHRSDVVEYIDDKAGPWTPGKASRD